MQPIAIDNYLRKHLDMHTKHETMIIHHSYARKNKWKQVIHQALHYFAHNPTNQKDTHWQSNRCWEPEGIDKVIDVIFLPQADDKKHVCDNGDEQHHHKPEGPEPLDHLNWLKIRDMNIHHEDEKIKYDIKMTNIDEET